MQIDCMIALWTYSTLCKGDLKRNGLEASPFSPYDISTCSE